MLCLNYPIFSEPVVPDPTPATLTLTIESHTKHVVWAKIKE